MLKTVGELRAAIADFRDDQVLLVEFSSDDTSFTDVSSVRQTASVAGKEDIVLLVVNF